HPVQKIAARNGAVHAQFVIACILHRSELLLRKIPFAATVVSQNFIARSLKGVRALALTYSVQKNWASAPEDSALFTAVPGRNPCALPRSLPLLPYTRLPTPSWLVPGHGRGFLFEFPYHPEAHTR